MFTIQQQYALQQILRTLFTKRSFSFEGNITEYCTGIINQYIECFKKMYLCPIGTLN
jgi:hypothetical protein